jgi:hypothetical protein
MDFKDKVLNYFKEHGVTVTRTEMPDEDFPSIVCHVPMTDNIKIANLKDVMEKVLGVVMVQSDMGGFNVVIVESEEDE